MARKILISPDYGAGWTSWHYGTKEELQFMLTYQPFIDFLENGGRFEENRENFENLEIVQKFIQDWKNKFPNKEVPFLGGLRDLKVVEVNGLVRIKEYDGYESYEEQDEYQGWI